MTAPAALTAALMALAYAGIPTDVQALLTQGSLSMGIAPGALQKAIDAAADAQEEADRIANTCDEPGCTAVAVCGWPTDAGGYRRTCAKHWIVAP